MKKRIVCVLLTLIMLVSLVPAAALTASAATRTTSEAAITVLKQMEGYSKNCENGFIGYGTKCPECNLKETEGHIMYEKEADKQLRAVLKDLDSSVNSFATKNGLGLTQGQHDALVLFSFENGTAWTNGTGEFQSAVKSGATGSKFLNAICLWDSNAGDDYRRMVEANMYLNGTYSSSEPARFVRVYFDANGGKYSANQYQYFDVAASQQITVTASKSGDVFLGWYRADKNEDEEDIAVRVSHVTAESKKHYAEDPLGNRSLVLRARWQDEGGEKILYTISKSSLLSNTVYSSVNGGKVTKYANKYDKEVKIVLGSTLNVTDDQIDKDGVRWAQIADADGYPMGWVKVKGTGNTSNTGSTSAAEGVVVTVTNAYVNMRKNASITSTKNGSFTQGTELLIIDTQNGKDGFLWGQVAKSTSDATPIGWVALMYTNYESAKNSGAATIAPSNGTVVATAIITYPGYVNLRSEAGTHNQIVGSLANGFEVDLYETKYVNGVEWGRCSSGWFCLIYADVTRLVANSSSISDVGYTAYVFTGKLDASMLDAPLKDYFFAAPAGDPVVAKDKKGEDKVLEKLEVTFSNLINQAGETWVKTSYGWIEMSKITMDVAKFYVIAENLTVRDNYDTTADRVDVLVKGTEFDVSQIVLVGDTIWGYANKTGEVVDPTYSGWVNLANKNVSRTGAPIVDAGSDKETASTGKIATVVGTDSVRVRKTGALSGTVLGSLSRGTSAAVLEENDGWYNLDIDVDNNPKTGSWVYGQYLEITTGTISGSSTTDSTGNVLTGKGIVANTYAGVNVRTGAGTGYASKGKLLPGTEVEILEVKTVGASKWGRTNEGWICMDYVTMVSNYVPAGSASGSTGSSNSTSSSTSVVAIYTGVTNDVVDIYKEASVNAEFVREDVPAGYPVTMHEIVTVTEITDFEESGNETTTVQTTTHWARVNEGYIMNPEENISLTAEDESIYTVTGSDVLNVRPDVGADSGDAVHKLKKGDQVIVNKYAIKGNNIWGHIETDIVNNTLVDEEGNEVKEYWEGEGWVSLSYMTKGAITIQTESNNTNNNTNSGSANAGNSTNIGSTGNTSTGGFVTNTSGYKYTGKVINTNEVNVRSLASTASSITTKLKNGAALVIYETTIAEGMAWGRCDAGWVYLYYVDLTPVNGAVDARVVYNDNTIVYSDMNCSSTTGTTYAKMSVIDIYEVVGKMARTDDGWVNVDNLL